MVQQQEIQKPAASLALLLVRSKAESSFQSYQQSIYAPVEINRLIAENADAWCIEEPQSEKIAEAVRSGKLIPLSSLTQNAILKALLEHTNLLKVRMPFPYRTETRFTWGDAPTYALIQSVHDDGYFSHYTAMHLHGLTDQIPKTIYFNVEQPASSGGGSLSQQAIDRAFQAKCRVSTNVITFRGLKVCKLNGGNTGQLGVVRLVTEEGSDVRVTNIERTLIDAVVRPVYAGGIAEIAAAFRAAADRLSVDQMADYLRKLNYTYPYHQAIGFYMERAGVYSVSQIEIMRQFPIEYDFYLNYQLKNPKHNERWRLFVPQRL